MEQSNGEQMPEKKSKMQTSSLYGKAARARDFKINLLTPLREKKLTNM